MPASPSTARAINDRLALRLLQQHGPLTAGQLKQLTGLSRPTVADLVERLTEAGLITVVGESGEQRRGPNARLYGIVADRAHLAALDVRTESVSVLVSDLVGRVLAEGSVPIGGDTVTGTAVERAVSLVERVAKEAGADSLHTVGVGAPGLIDPATGELRDSSGLPAWHRSLVAALQEHFPEARVIVENETNLAALAEQREGAARDRDTFVLLWLGQGTGAALVLDGILRRGASGGAGEIGFLPVPGTGGLPSAVRCDGGFHSIASADAIAELAAGYGLTGDADAEGRRERGARLAARVVRGAVDRLAGPPDPAGPDAGGSDAVAWLARPDAGVRPVGEGAVAGTADRAGASERATRADAAEPGRRDGVAGTGGRVGVAGTGGRVGVAGTGERGGVDGRSARSAAAGFLDALADRIAIGAASVAAVLDPGCVVLGGEIGRAGGAGLAARVGERVRLLSPLTTEVRCGELGGQAVLRGALLTVRERAQDELFAPPEK